MTDSGEMSYFLRVKVNQIEKKIFMSQKKYVEQILSKFRIKDCKPVTTLAEVGMKFWSDLNREPVNPTLYNSLVRSLRYLTFTWLDIMYVVGLVSRYMETPKQDHFIATKRISRYGLFYKHSYDSKLVGYSDSDYMETWMIERALLDMHFTLGQ